MEEWWEEEVDIDDCDIASLRPCNKSNIFSSDSARTSTLAPRNPNSSIDSIPGPAGVLQSSMILTSRNYTPRFSISDPRSSIDRDFLSIPWITALDFVRNNGLNLGRIRLGECIGSIRKLTEVGRVPQLVNHGILILNMNILVGLPLVPTNVIGIVTSCKPNGLGDLTVILKDLSGLMVGSIHHKVLQGEMGKNISVGCVLILQKVSFFSTELTEHCLNITRRNLIKVVPVEFGREERSEDEQHLVSGESGEKGGEMEQVEAAQVEIVEENMNGCMGYKGGVRQVGFSRGGIGEWTDEQLDELLFVDDCL